VIFDKKTGQLLGAHMVGAEVTELIQGYVIAMNLETTEEELMHTVFPHPTLSEQQHYSPTSRLPGGRESRFWVPAFALTSGAITQSTPPSASR
jgi:hypothetical protein